MICLFLIVWLGVGLGIKFKFRILIKELFLLDFIIKLFDVEFRAINWEFYV